MLAAAVQKLGDHGLGMKAIERGFETLGRKDRLKPALESYASASLAWRASSSSGN